jgi:uncharacterized membrane protein
MKNNRIVPLDLLRGLIMAIMAIDHASYFAAKIHHFEFWGFALPHYPDTISFVTRFVTHICAPGFFFLMGTGMMLLANSRQNQGWTEGKITRFFLKRGFILVFLQFFLENPAWLIGISTDKSRSLSSIMVPGGGEEIWFFFGVLYALGMSMVIWALLLRFKSSVILALSFASILLPQILIPSPANVERIYSPFLRALLIPGQTGIMQAFYPLIPWLGITGLGIVFGRGLISNRKKAHHWALFAGMASVILFLILRALESFGNIHSPQGASLMAFLNLTKYPPSLTFILLFMGLNCLFLYFLAKWETALEKCAKPLVTFGQTALFFYIVHLYLYAFIGIAFPQGTGYGLLYVIWLGGLAVLYPLCFLYRRFKRKKSHDSIWRFF